MSTSGGGAEREGDKESETGSRLLAVSTPPNVRLELKLRDNDLSQSQMLNPGVPQVRAVLLGDCALRTDADVG